MTPLNSAHLDDSTSEFSILKIWPIFLTDLVNAMLDTAELSKEWWGEAILTACHVVNRVPTKNKEITPFEEWEKKRPTLSYLRTRGCLAKVSVPITKKCKLGPKTMDCVFLGYAIHSEIFNSKIWSTWHACWYNNGVQRCYIFWKHFSHERWNKFI